MNRRIRGKINSGEVGALYDNGRKNKTTAKCKWVYTRNACRKMNVSVRQLQNGKRQTKIIRIEKSGFEGAIDENY